MPSGPGVPKQKPIESYPTPQVLDTLLWESVDRNSPGYRRLEVGSKSPDRSKYPDCLLVAEIPIDGSDNMVRRYWSSQYQLQDAYNYSITYGQESAAHPQWARRYLVRRDAYIVAAYGAPFTGIFLIRVTNGGQNYSSPPAVTFAGGSGSSATAEALLSDNGVVQWIRITANGTGYTSAPTIGFVGGGGSGATAVAVMQGASKLVHQEVQQLPADDPRYSQFVMVLRVWETIPGPELIGKYIDFDKGRVVTVTKQTVDAGTEPDDVDGMIASGVRPLDANRSERTLEVAESFTAFTSLPNVNSLQSWKQQQLPRTEGDLYTLMALAVKDSPLPGIGTAIEFRGIEMLIVERESKGYSDKEDQWMIQAIPADLNLLSYVEFVRAGIRFPGLYQFLEQFVVSFTFPYRPPFPGIHDNYLAPRTNTIPARQTHYFVRGLPDSIPEKFTVISPGTASKMVPIREDTIHPPIVWYVTVDGVTTMVENLPASSPETYDPSDIYLFDVEATRYLGNIYEVTLTEASEGRGITYFPPAQRSLGITIGPYGGGLEVADYSQTGIFAVNTNAGANNVQVFGFQGPTWKRLQGTTPVDAGLVDFGFGVLNTIEVLSGDGISQADGVEFYTYGVAGESTIIFGSNPANNDQIKLGFLNGTATYNTTYTFKTILTENILATGTLTLVANVTNNDTSSIGPAADLQTWTFKTILSENVKATGTLTTSGAFPVAPDGSSIAIGARAYTFVDPFVNLPNNIYSGTVSMAESVDNLVAAITGGAGAGTLYGTGTPVNTEVTATAPSSNMTVTALAGGLLGNNIATSTSAGLTGYASFANATLLGGLAAAANEVFIGGSASITLDNYIAAINGGAGMGTLYSTGTVASAYVTAAAGVGDTLVASSLTGGTAANLILTQETFTNGGNVWGAANLTGGSAPVAYEVQRGGSAIASSQNLQAAINGTGTAGVAFSTGTVANPILVVPNEQTSATFIVSTRIAADWESFGSWQTGANFVWITDANGAFPVNDFGTVGALTGAENGTQIGTLTTAAHSLVTNQQDFDSPNLKNRNFPPTPDDLLSSVLFVGNRRADIFYGQYGGMSLSYEKSVDGVVNWVSGDETMPTLTGGQRRRVPVQDFDWNPDTTPANLQYKYIRFIITPASSAIGPTHDYGQGRVSRLFLTVAVDI